MSDPVERAKIVTVALPRLPISKSNSYRVVTISGHGAMTLTQAARQFQEEVCQALAPTVAQHLGALYGPDEHVAAIMVVHYQALTKAGKPRLRVPDIDNGWKAVLDGAEDAGLFRNDNQISDTYQSRRPAAQNRTLITFCLSWYFPTLITKLFDSVSYDLPSPATRKEWAERKRIKTLIDTDPDFVAAAAAKCFGCDMLIGPYHLHQEVWAFTTEEQAVLVCETCAEEWSLPQTAYVTGAIELIQLSKNLKERYDWVEQRLAKKLIFGRKARDLLHRHRPFNGF